MTGSGRPGSSRSTSPRLRGTYGVRELEKDGTGRTLRVLSTTTAPQAGNSLILTIDAKEQRLAQQALDWGLKLSGAKRGAIVVMNPQTGEILAMISAPTYDANLFSRGISTADFQKLLAEQEPPAHEPRDQRHPAARVRRTSWSRARAPSPTRSSA